MFNVSLDVFDDNNRVIHDDTDRQRKAEQAQGVDREAYQIHDGKSAHVETGTATRWLRSAPGYPMGKSDVWIIEDHHAARDEPNLLRTTGCD
ncbi:hypothetical protein GGE50_003835 [Rhizobium leguminosarum]|nr:hypothetical protein [Rhizobium leguminosarum]